MAYNNNYNNDYNNYNNYNNDPYNNNQYYDNNQYNNQYNGSYNNYNYTDPQFVEANKKRNKRNTVRQNAEYLEQYRMMQNQNNYNNYNNNYNNYNNNGPVIRPKKNTKFVADNRLVRLIVFGSILLIAIIVGITILIINLTSSSGSKTNTVTNTEVVNDYQTVGNNSLGYVTIPSDWVKFQDAKGSVRGLQYSDVTTAYILTMDALNATEVDAETWAKSKATEFQKLGVKDVKGSKVKIGSYEAYQVYGYYEPAKKWLSIWCFKVDKIVHYIGIEGPDNNSEYFKIVNTFKPTKETTTNTTNTNTQKK